MMDGDRLKRRSTLIVLYTLLSIPIGALGAIPTSVIPFVLRKQGITLENIGWYANCVTLSAVLQVFYVPIVEFGPKRKIWAFALSLCSAICFALSLVLPGQGHIEQSLLFAIAGQIFYSLVTSCYFAALSPAIEDAKHGRAMGWYNAGTLIGGGLGAGGIFELLGHYSVETTALVFPLLVLVPLIAILVLPEPLPRAHVHRPQQTFALFWRELWQSANLPAARLGLLFSVLPAGSLALNTYFPAVAVDYHVSPWMVGVLNGTWGWLLTAAGSFLGGHLPARSNWYRVYVVTAVIMALVGLFMAAAPVCQTTYAIGVIVYYFVQGVAMTAYLAMISPVIAQSPRSAATLFSVFNAVSNIGLMYMVYIDSKISTRYGLPGLFAMDGGLCLVSSVLLMILLFFVKPPQNPPQDASL